jgi:hypothetical protein
MGNKCAQLTSCDCLSDLFQRPRKYRSFVSCCDRIDGLASDDLSSSTRNFSTPRPRGEQRSQNLLAMVAFDRCDSDCVECGINEYGYEVGEIPRSRRVRSGVMIS